MMVPIVFQPRTYRDFDGCSDFKIFRVVVETSDLYVKAHSYLGAETERLIRECRSQIERSIARRREFLTSLDPIEEDPADSPAVLQMIRAGKRAGTGPMAAVAGLVAEYVGRRLLQWSPEVIVENGGDIFVHVARPIIVGLLAGKSPFSGRTGIRIDPTPVSVGVCTSSGTVGPSLSLGVADSATVISHDAALADAVATATGNRVRKPSDLREAVQWALTVPGVQGAIAVLDDRIAAQGAIELMPLAGLAHEEHPDDKAIQNPSDD
jgi:ApbE superfamily uncharacterized protein (UPF0280 family)